MKKNFNSFLFLFCLLMLSQPSYPTSFLDMAMVSPAGIRALGMGGAFTAVAQGPSSILYNPAGLVIPGFSVQYENLDYKKIHLNRSERYEVYFSPFCFSNSVLSAQTGELVAINRLGFGKRGTNGVHWGVVYKTLSVTENNIQTNGWSTDLGILVNFTPLFNLGITAQDLFSEKIELPTTLRAGISLSTVPRAFIGCLDVVYQKNQAAIFHVGAEYEIADGLALRGGAYQNTLTGGIGIQIGTFELSLAIVSPQDQSAGTVYLLGCQLGNYSDWPTNRKFKDFL